VLAVLPQYWKSLQEVLKREFNFLENTFTYDWVKITLNPGVFFFFN